MASTTLSHRILKNSKFGLIASLFWFYKTSRVCVWAGSKLLALSANPANLPFKQIGKDFRIVIMTFAAFGIFQKRHYDVCSLWSFSQIVMMTIAHFGHFLKSSWWRLSTLVIFSNRHHDDCPLWRFSQNVIMTFAAFAIFQKRHHDVSSLRFSPTSWWRFDYSLSIYAMWFIMNSRLEMFFVIDSSSWAVRITKKQQFLYLV